MATANDAARWMLEEVQRSGHLAQEQAFDEIQQRFGGAFTYINDQGGNAIDKRVLSAFRRLSGDTVVWARRSCYWRMRQPGDDPSRVQYE